MMPVVVLLRQFTLVLALLGLVGQSAAYAMPMCDHLAKAELAQGAEMAAMADCMKGEHKTDKGSEPCKGMTPGCMARIGCVSLPTLAPLAICFDLTTLDRQELGWHSAPTLHGRTVPPDLHPPAFLV